MSLRIIQFTDNIDYWVANSFKFQFQNMLIFWIIGGIDINIYGSDTPSLTGVDRLGGISFY